MSFSQILAKTWRENLLFSVLLELTYRCNLDCFFCYNDLGLKGQPLSRADYFQLFEDLAGMQVLNLTFSGGEPLAHPDFLLLGRKARELGFVVRIKSNGHALRGELLRRLREEVDPFLVEVSLHGATPATHDRQTRVPGSFDRLLANIEEMRARGLRVKVNSTLTAWNEGEIEAMFDLVAQLGLPLQVDPEVSPRDDGSREPLAISPSREGVLRLFTLERARQADVAPSAETSDPAEAPGISGIPAVARGADDGTLPTTVHKHCGAGSSGIAIDPYGNVYPCVQWRRPVGNLHRQRVADLWA
ncbi:MAG TPA: radical SAM protein, partial [Thermoanaerobaculia bacterium]|nr:radical SAM protein [Thermoanaerobaculia bacterium]